MTVYLGDTQTELFYREGGAGETFTRVESAIDGVDTTWNPTFTDLGSGWYQYTYAPSVTGIHTWGGTGDQGPPIALSFDVDPVRETVITLPSTTTVASSTVSRSPGGVQPAYVDELVIIQGEDWYWPMRLLGGGSLIDTTDYNAQLTVRATAEGGQVLFASVNNGKIFVGYDPPKRTNNTAYTTGSYVVPSTLNGYIYQATVGGTTASSAPLWPTTIGNTVTDGTVTWTCVASDAIATNLRVALIPSDTDNVAEWGIGRFDLEITDTYSKQSRIVEGNAVLSRAITRPA